MALFFLEYDLRKPNRDYQSLYEELGEFGAVQILESLWCFNRVNTDAQGLRDHFSQFIDKNDGVIVSQVSDWASIGTNAVPHDLPPA